MAEVPENNNQLLQTQMTEQQPDVETFPPGSPEFRYWNMAAALARGINFWAPLLPEGTRWTTDQQPLQVQIDEGVDLNAFFARDSGLNFFHDDVETDDGTIRVFSGESPSV